MDVQHECSANGLESLERLRAGYQRNLAAILACSQSLLVCDAWHYDPERLDAVLEISNHIRRAADGMRETGHSIKTLERRLGLSGI